MPIYDIFDVKGESAQREEAPVPTPLPKKDRLFSALTARVLFFLLLVADLLWAVYAISLFLITSAALVATLGKSKGLRGMRRRQWIAVKRSIVCALALMVTLFSPALGIMIACTYFLMYDKTGIQEVVPSSLQEQFQEFFQV
jgi:hypothetical protein